MRANVFTKQFLEIGLIRIMNERMHWLTIRETVHYFILPFVEFKED